MNKPVLPALLVCFAASHALAQDELWRQDPIDSCGGYSSQDARNGGGLGWFSEVADNFQGQGGTSVGSLMFWGGYCTPPGEEGNTTGFTVRFYTDDNGNPGDRIFEQDVFEFTEVQYADVGGRAGYEYTIDLGEPFDVSADEQLWVTIVALLARGGGEVEPQWFWIVTGSVNQPPAQQWFFDPGNFGSIGVDMSFVLFAASDSCPADLDGDGDADADDFFAYLDAFAAGDFGVCDIDTDGDCDADDFFGYLDLFAQGC